MYTELPPTATQNDVVGQDNPYTGSPPPGNGRPVQVEPSNVYATPPTTATHALAVAHDTVVGSPSPRPSGLDHVPPFRVSPQTPVPRSLPSATQNVALGQDTEVSRRLDGAGVAGASGPLDQRPPEYVASPDPGTAAQNVAVGQDTEKNPYPASASGVGVFNLQDPRVYTYVNQPTPSADPATAAQKEGVAHDTAFRMPVPLARRNPLDHLPLSNV